MGSSCPIHETHPYSFISLHLATSFPLQLSPAEIKARKEKKEQNSEKREAEEQGRSLLSFCSDLDIKSVRRFLLTEPSAMAINYKNNGGNTPLIQACNGTKETQAREITQMLVEYQVKRVPVCDVNIQNRQDFQHYIWPPSAITLP